MPSAQCYFVKMLFALKRLLILLMIVFGVYCFWPRKSSLAHFDPARMAELQVTAWRQASAKSKLELVPTYYEIFERQYNIPPISSLKMAFDASQAVIRFQRAPDIADQEKALFPLRMVFAALRDNTKTTFDPDALAQLELLIWTLRSESAKRAQLTSALSDQLALLYSQPSSACLPAAKKFAIAMKLANEHKWNEAQTSCAESWREIKILAESPRK